MTAPPILDPRVGGWTFDTTSLWSLEEGGLMGSLAITFRDRIFLLADVLQEMRGSSVVSPRSGTLGSLMPWYQRVELTLPQHQVLYRALRQHWHSAADKDRGEAACIAVSAANDWTFVTDDRVAFQTAKDPPANLCVVRTTTLVLAMTRAGWITSGDSWAAVMAMETAGRHPGPRPATAGEWDMLCGATAFDPCRHAPATEPGEQAVAE